MSFELLGFDILLTSDFKPILLEVNHAPSFATDSPLDYEIKHAIFVDMPALFELPRAACQAIAAAAGAGTLRVVSPKTSPSSSSAREDEDPCFQSEVCVVYF